MVRGAGGSRPGRRHPEIATAVIALAGSLGLATVAEGLETAASAAELTRLGATYLQGLGLARSMTGAAAAAWFATRTAEPHP